MMDHQLETTCERCGTRHRVLESMPNRPFAPEDVERLDRSCAFVGAVGATRPADVTASEEAATTTNTLVVSTTRATRLLRRAEDFGWVVDREREHDDGEQPATVGLHVFVEATPESRLTSATARTVLGLGGQ
ncbi:hypothetical protein [Halomarina oriensis]|uniref:DUF7964 domain-containing protein n=1 Tax=Halomarina oriensis TaxID=671145 RepID=A0A6B0GMN6_9EURY|nr:hypothetical protein [Halomarina oriensis]MWG35920.1 hypothetical protein [Halomarina oriensis]